MILLSLHPGPPSETSAFRRMRAFSSRLAGPLPLRTSACSCSRSSAFSRTTYFFTAMSFPAMIPSAARIATKANHPILSNWLKLTTRLKGELLLHVGRCNEVEEYLAQALNAAREQSARLPELRAAMSVARLWRNQGKRKEALDLLAPVYG